MKTEWTREEIIAIFERETGEKASDYPADTKTMDFWIWTRDAADEKARRAEEARRA